MAGLWQALLLGMATCRPSTSGGRDSIVRSCGCLERRDQDAQAAERAVGRGANRAWIPPCGPVRKSPVIARFTGQPVPGRSSVLARPRWLCWQRVVSRYICSARAGRSRVCHSAWPARSGGLRSSAR